MYLREKLLLYILFLLLICPQLVYAEQKAVLNSIEKKDSLEKTSFIFKFDKLPSYQINTSGQRVDVLLDNVKFSPDLKKLPEDYILVRTLYIQKELKSVVSFVLRRIPKSVESSTLKGKKQIVVDLQWPQAKDLSQPAIAYALKGNLVIAQNKAVAGRYLKSKYSGNWIKFFREYERPVKIDVSFHYSLAPIKYSSIFYVNSKTLDKAFELATNTRWKDALQELNAKKSSLGKANPAKSFKRIDLLRAEVLLRMGKRNQAKYLLDKLARKMPTKSENQWVFYLRAYAQASSISPYVAYYKYVSKKSRVRFESKQKWLQEYFRLLQAEMSLDTGHIKKALNLLKSEPEAESGPKGFSPLNSIYSLRRAQARYLLGEKETAYKIYSDLAQDINLFPKYPQALAQYADLLYERNNYEQAFDHYIQLVNSLEKRKKKALGYYKAALAKLHGQAKQTAKQLLKKLIQDNYPKDLASYLAKIKENDLKMLKDYKKDFLKIASSYQLVSDYAPVREVREEAAFKRILVLYLNNEDYKSLKMLESFLRDFRAGPLHSQAQVLATEILPGVVQKLINKGRWLEGLAMVARHRDILVQTDLSFDFLQRLAQVFKRLGLYGRAMKIYAYMLTCSDNAAEKENVYLPIINTCLQSKNLDLVIKYADKYFELYPQGKDRAEIYYLKAKALQQKGDLQSAAKILLKTDRPLSRKLDILTAKILFAMKKYTLVERFLSRAIVPDWEKASSSVLLMRADALFESGCLKQALPIYEFLRQKQSYFDHATYKSAQILLSIGERKKGLKLLQKISDNTSSDLWAKLAEETKKIHGILDR